MPDHPFLNASLNGDEIICWKDVHLSIATSLKDYLIVPLIRLAQEKNWSSVAVRSPIWWRAPSKMDNQMTTIIFPHLGELTITDSNSGGSSNV